MAIVTVQTDADEFSGDQNPALTPASTPTENNFFMLVVYRPQSAAAISSVTQTNVSWVLEDSFTATADIYSADLYIGSSTGGTPGSTVTVNLAAADDSILLYSEMSGVQGVNTTSPTLASNSSTMVTTSITTGQPINRAMGIYAYDNSGGELITGYNSGFAEEIALDSLVLSAGTTISFKDTTSGASEISSVSLDSNVPYKSFGLSLIGESIEDLEGDIPGTTTVAGTLSSDIGLAGLVDAQSTVSGPLTIDSTCLDVFPRVLTHKDDALDNLIAQFQNSSNLKKLLCSYMTQVQELEEAINFILDKFNLDCATNDQLDILGRIVNEFRQGQTDDEFRTAIRAKIAANTSDGTIEDLITIGRAALNQQGTISITEIFPGAAFVSITNTTLSTITASQVLRFLILGSPAGVRIFYIFIPSNSFGLTNAALSENTGKGFDQGRLFASIL